MIQLQIPVRNSTLQAPVRYTFKDSTGAVINLSSYVSAFLEVKLFGQPFATVPGSITQAANGVVQVSSFTFTIVGVWTLQFYCVDGSSNKLYGEPLLLTVVPNVDDLALSQLPKY